MRNSFYYIKHINTNLSIIFSQNNISYVKLSISEGQPQLAKWLFIQIDNNIYKIQNKNKCFIQVKNFKIYCENISLEEASEFTILKIYEEVRENNFDNQLVENEPIDALIKYIDLRDNNLTRRGINQIKKDYDNEELRYSIRSIFQNIPWIRKIFILMPNEKVRFLDDKNVIKERITYVKDKDLLGFDSANSLSFQFNYWKMKLFGISDNFIAMDDDCFIGKPLKKTDFFYVSNGRITPIIITNKFIKLNKIMIKNNLILFKKTINKYKKKQSSAEFKYSLYNTYLFILDLFKEARFFPVHTHNAIPININDLKEIYDIIYDSKFKYSTLYSIYRQIDSLQFQALFLSYNYIKYKKKVKNISNKLIQNKYSLFSDYNFSLFCINTGSINYSPSSFLKTKIVMEYLFPFPNSYEIT